MATPIPANHCAFTLAEVAKAVAGTLSGADPAVAVSSVSTDTRVLAPKALFVALCGSNFDGHAHLGQAERRGAVAALVRRGIDTETTSLGRIEVDDTLIALGKLARFHADRVRAARAVPSIAVTGSAGKTTTKELVAAALRALYGPTLATVGNLNNLVGVPMSLFTLTQEHRAMVIECGTSARGEIARLGSIVSPDVSLVLNADAGHTEGIGSVQDVAEEKGCLFAAATRAVVANADDSPSLGQLGRAQPGVFALTFGQNESADVRLVGRTVERDGHAKITVELGPKVRTERALRRFDLGLHLLGRAAALDAVAALAAVVALRSGELRDLEELTAVSEAFAAVRPVSGRLAVRSVGDLRVVDDSYNANPRSVRAALEAARELSVGLGSRLLVVLGDMLELGSLSAELHAAVAQDVLRSGAVLFVSVGSQMALAARAAAGAGRAGLIVVETAHTDDAAAAIAGAMRPGDVVLVKGSRGMTMERVIEALQGQATLGVRQGKGSP